MSTQNYLVNQPNYNFLQTLGIKEKNHGSFANEWFASGPTTQVISPINKSIIAEVQTANLNDYEKVAKATLEAYNTWREVPAPIRGK